MKNKKPNPETRGHVEKLDTKSEKDKSSLPRSMTFCGRINNRRLPKGNFVLGFTTNKGLMLDLDNTTLKETKKIADKYLKRFKLEGFLIVRSSQNNYHVIFNRYLSWKKTIEYLFKIVWFYHYHKRGQKPNLTYWAILQACKGSATLRISTKKHKRVPSVVMFYGKTDKLINDYLQYYDIGEK